MEEKKKRGEDEGEDVGGGGGEGGEEKEQTEEEEEEEEEKKKKKKKKKKNVMCYTTVKVILISNLGVLHRLCTSVSPKIPSFIYGQTLHIVTLCHDRFHTSATVRLRVRDGAVG